MVARNAPTTTKTAPPATDPPAAEPSSDDEKYLTKAEAPGLIRGVLEDFFGDGEGAPPAAATDPPAAEPSTYKEIEAAAERLVETAVAKLTKKPDPPASPAKDAAANAELTPTEGRKPQRFLEKVFGWTSE